MKRSTILLLAALAALTWSASAGAATWTVWAGEPSKPPAGTPKSATLNQFLPAVIQVHQGDRITFTSRGFHTASFLGRHEHKAHPIFLPDPERSTYTDINDAAGNPFWFNGQRKFIFNPEVLGPVGEPTVDDREMHNSGVMLPGPRGPGKYTFTFPRAGTFKVFCLIHPGMQGRVVVKPAGEAIPTAAAVQTQAAKQLATSWAEARTLAKTKAPARTVYAGVGKKTTLFAFLPERLTVPVGTTVSFVERSPSEVHNIAFGPRRWLKAFEQANEIPPRGPGSPNQVLPFYLYASDRGRLVHDGANHGNGVLATGLLDGVRGGLPNRVSITFTKAGKYHYYCQIHGPNMAGDIVVTG